MWFSSVVRFREVGSRGIFDFRHHCTVISRTAHSPKGLMFLNRIFNQFNRSWAETEDSSSKADDSYGRWGSVIRKSHWQAKVGQNEPFPKCGSAKMRPIAGFAVAL